MARETTIPGPSTIVQDYGLNVTPSPAVKNKRVLIIGTAEDGPQYEPIRIEKPEDSEYAFGRLGAGDLVRGIYETWSTQEGTPDVVGVRIGNGKLASLDILESDGSGKDAPNSPKNVALKLEAKFPGSVYNQVTVAYDENRNIAIYNPKTGIYTKFSVDTQRANNPNAQVHNVRELVDAINSDRNANQVIVASTADIQADYEVAISGVSSAVTSNAGGQVKIDLAQLVAGNFVVSGSNSYIVGTPINYTASASNNISELELVEAVSISEYEKLETKGLSSSTLKLNPLDGKGTSDWDTIQALKDYNGDGKWIHNASGVVVGEYIYSVNNELIDSVPTDYSGVNATNTLRFSIDLPLDDSEEASNNLVASGYITPKLANTYAGYGVWTNLTNQAIDTKLIDGEAVRPSGKIKVFVSDTQDTNGFWQELPYHKASGIYVSSYTPRNGATPGYVTLAIGTSLTANVSGVMRKLVDSNGAILKDKFVRITGNSVKGLLSEVSTLPELEDAGTQSLQTYFVRGQEILFNKSPDFDIIVNYGTRSVYESGSDVSLSDASKGEITFTDPAKLPGPGGGQLVSNKKSYIRFRYKYMPNFPAITSAAKSLSGGTNGNQLTNAQRRDEFQKAYDNLRNYDASIIVPMGAYIDATATRFNPITGLKEEISAGFATQLDDFLEDLSINSKQPHAILGVTPPSDITQAVKDAWVKRLTEVDETDQNRAANIMSQIQSKFISVAAFEPIFPNTGRGRAYSANGQAAYAGMLASLAYHLSPTNKPIRNILNVKFDLSVPQYEKLDAMRYVMMKARPGKSPVIVNDVTAAPYGSDFAVWSNFSIMSAAADRVRSVAEEYVGKPNSIVFRNAMDQEISNALQSMSGLQAFDFSINSSLNQQTIGIVEIDLVIVPEFTMKKIRTSIKLRRSIEAAG